MKVPILRRKSILMISFQDDMTDRDAIDVQFDLLDMIENSEARAVMMDMSSLESTDSFQSKMISETAAMARILGCEVILSGMKPKVALTLVELGDVMSGIHSVLNLDQGMLLLETKLATRNGSTSEGKLSADLADSKSDSPTPFGRSRSAASSSAESKS